MQNANGFSISGLEPVALQPLVAPDGLKQTLGRKAVFVVQNICGARLRAPGIVKIAGGRVHLEIAFAPALPQSQADTQNFERSQWLICFLKQTNARFGSGIFVGRNPGIPARIHPTF